MYEEAITALFKGYSVKTKVCLQNYSSASAKFPAGNFWNIIKCVPARESEEIGFWGGQGIWRNSAIRSLSRNAQE